MATVTVESILNRANTLLNDQAWVRWPKQELLDYYNDATKAIVLVRPDAHTKHETFSCAEGTKQDLPKDALRLIEVIRNSTGKVIRFVPRKALDDSYPDWHASAKSESVSAYTYDERYPKIFYLYPGTTASHNIDLVYSVAPQSKTIVEVEADAVADLDDIYINPMIDFILYRAFSKDSEYSANINRANTHYQAFMQQLGEKINTDAGMAQAKDAGFSRVTGQ